MFFSILCDDLLIHTLQTNLKKLRGTCCKFKMMFKLFECWNILHVLVFFFLSDDLKKKKKMKKSFKKFIRVNVDPDQVKIFVWPDVGPNFFAKVISSPLKVSLAGIGLMVKHLV